MSTSGEWRGTPTWTTWASMLTRCRNRNATNFRYYGGRGISVCDRWRRFDLFLSDMGARPGPDYTIERLDNNRGYEPENCEWVSRVRQARNRRNNRLVVFRGERMTLIDAVERSGLCFATVARRLYTLRWPEEDVFAPLRREGPRARKGSAHE
jgi:hypothetical protein